MGLALDPEWMIGPEEVPLDRIGSSTAADVNEVVTWLADLVDEAGLPQKVFILHQFNLEMLPDRENIIVDRPELAMVLHTDGSGDPGMEFDTWNVLRQGLSPMIHLGWKNFIDGDTLMFTPQQTLQDVQPTPVFVSYQ